MTEATPTPTPQAPAAAKPAEPAAPAATPPAAAVPAASAASAPKPGDPAPGFNSEESKNAVLADLAKERTKRQELEARIDAQNKAMAAALGLEEAPKTDDLAETVRNLIQQELAPERLKTTRLEIASSHKIPAEYHHLLTETDTEKLTAQAVTVAALVAANGTPAFQPNPGQGQGGAPASPEAIAEAEYLQYHPLPSRK